MISCPNCSENFQYTFPDRRGKGLRRIHIWLACPSCKQAMEVTVNFSETSYDLIVEKAA